MEQCNQYKLWFSNHMFIRRLLFRVVAFRISSLTSFKKPLTSLPQAMSVKEGSATVSLLEGVFYNPVQEFNRDLTVAVIKHYAKIHLLEFINRGVKKVGENNQPESATYLGLSVLEALAASGLRSVRFANELPLLSRIISNDLDPEATKMIAENAKINSVDDIIRPSCADAIKLMLDAVKDK